MRVSSGCANGRRVERAPSGWAVLPNCSAWLYSWSAFPYQVWWDRRDPDTADTVPESVEVMSWGGGHPDRAFDWRCLMALAVLIRALLTK